MKGVELMTNISTQPPVKDETSQAITKLLAELSKGLESILAEGGLTVEEAFSGLEA